MYVPEDPAFERCETITHYLRSRPCDRPLQAGLEALVRGDGDLRIQGRRAVLDSIARALENACFLYEQRTAHLKRRSTIERFASHLDGLGRAVQQFRTGEQDHPIAWGFIGMDEILRDAVSTDFQDAFFEHSDAVEALEVAHEKLSALVKARLIGMQVKGDRPTLERLFVRELGFLYCDLAAKRPAFSLDIEERATGQFVRFVEAAGRITSQDGWPGPLEAHARTVRKEYRAEFDRYIATGTHPQVSVIALIRR